MDKKSTITVTVASFLFIMFGVLAYNTLDSASKLQAQYYKTAQGKQELLDTSRGFSVLENNTGNLVLEVHKEFGWNGVQTFIDNGWQIKSMTFQGGTPYNVETCTGGKVNHCYYNEEFTDVKDRVWLVK